MEVNIIPIPDSPGKYIIYRPLIGLAFVGNRAMSNLVLTLADESVAESPAAAQGEVLEFLGAIGFFDPDPPAPVPYTADFRPTTAVLLLTNQCQLRCVYCYAAAGESPRQELSLDLGRVAIDAACQNALDLGRPEFEVSFHGGGEPTFAWQTLQACTAYARQKPLKARITVVSNGVWSPAQCEWIMGNLDSLSLSMDGSFETQDRQRPLNTGRGSSEQVMRTIAALDERKFPYGIRMTATAPWTLPQDVRFICEHTQCRSIQVEPAFNIKRGGHCVPDEAEVRDFVQACVEAFDVAAQAGARFSYSGARLGMVTSAFCTAPFEALIVNANGDLVTCYEVASEKHPLAQMSIIGRVENGAVQVNWEARAHLHALMAERRASCRDCFVYWSCAGNCYARAFDPEPGGHLHHGERCTINQSITRELLLRRITEGDGVWRALRGNGIPQNGGPVSVITTGAAD
jgi:uncharacterized protein